MQELCKGFLDRHVLTWYDVHLMMSLAHTPAGSEATAKFLLAEQLIKVSDLLVCLINFEFLLYNHMYYG